MVTFIKRGFVLLVLAALLAGCKPSDKIVGEWYARSNTGEEVKIDFSKEKIMGIQDSDNQEEQLAISQTSTGFINEVRYFGIDIEGEKHYVVFENKKDEDNAILIKQTNHASDFEDVVGDIIYIMNRNRFPEQ